MCETTLVLGGFQSGHDNTPTTPSGNGGGGTGFARKGRLQKKPLDTTESGESTGLGQHEVEESFPRSSPGPRRLRS